MTEPRVFISYSHDSEAHREAVLQLAQQLRGWGVDVRIDRFIAAPGEGWPRWMMTEVDAADFVILVCTATYRRRFDGYETAGKGKGVTFEALLAIQHLYDANSRNEKFIPVIFEGAAEADIPLVLRPYQRHTLPGQFEALYRQITGQPEVVPAALGPRKILPPRGAVSVPFIAAAAPAVSAPALTRSTLPPAPVRSEGGGDVRIEPAELLHSLLLSLFATGDAFRQWVSLGPDGSALVAEFPGGSASASASIFGGLDVLRRRGYLAEDFFARLAAEFPRRRADVARVASGWAVHLAPPPTAQREPAAPPTPATTHDGLHVTGNIHTSGGIIGGDNRITHNAGRDNIHAPVTTHNETVGVKQVFEGPVNLVTPATPTVPAGDFELQRHLSRLLPEVDHINITGIRSRPGASRDALRRPIEELYTPLRSHRPCAQTNEPPNPDRDPMGDSLDPPPESEPVELPELQRGHHRLLLEGQPGSGKTTFINLVACMLARDLSVPAVPPPPDAPSWRYRHLGMTGPAAIPGLVRIAHLVQILLKQPSDARGDDRRWLLHILALRACPEEQLDIGPGDHAHQRRCKQWDALLTEGRAVLLLDGLDEVADEELRERVLKIFRDACTTWQKSAIVVTSRPIQTEALQLLGFHGATIDPFEMKQIKRFVHQWSDALHDDRAPESSRHKARLLLKAIAGRVELRDLATNPVMLTCLCVVHWNEGGLPEGRARVYCAVFHWMLRSREAQRAEAGYTDEFAEYAFPTLALAMMTGRQGKRARIDLWEAARALDANVAREQPGETNRARWAKTWLMRECEWSHIVEEVEGDELKFWHLTMQEYAAALALAQRRDDDPKRDWWPLVRERLDDPQWRETIALLPGCLYDEGGRGRVDRFVERVLEAGEPGQLVDAARCGVLGWVLPTMRAYKYRMDPELVARLRALQERAIPIFTLEGAAQVPPLIRVAAAEALGAAGFPRPAGDFIPLPGMGVALAKFPATVAEFAAFVTAGGYADDANWDAEGLRFRAEYGWTKPVRWDSQQEHPTRPVIGVSWYEARAYCRRRARRLGQPARLPRVAEWEFAASPDGRKYPWGDAVPTADLANFNNDVGEATPVGVYPAGAGKFGHEDLAGNVWEWCEDGEPATDAERRRRRSEGHWLKGGAWFHEERALAAAYRSGLRSGNRVGRHGFRVVVSTSRLDL